VETVTTGTEQVLVGTERRKTGTERYISGYAQLASGTERYATGVQKVLVGYDRLVSSNTAADSSSLNRQQVADAQNEILDLSTLVSDDSSVGSSIAGELQKLYEGLDYGRLSRSPGLALKNIDDQLKRLGQVQTAYLIGTSLTTLNATQNKLSLFS
jgi:hypothetical protein